MRRGLRETLVVVVAVARHLHTVSSLTPCTAIPRAAPFANSLSAAAGGVLPVDAKLNPLLWGNTDPCGDKLGSSSSGFQAERNQHDAEQMVLPVLVCTAPDELVLLKIKYQKVKEPSQKACFKVQ